MYSVLPLMWEVYKACMFQGCTQTCLYGREHSGRVREKLSTRREGPWEYQVRELTVQILHTLRYYLNFYQVPVLLFQIKEIV